MPLTQENRLIAIDTPLGKDALLLTEFSGEEEVSSLFTFQLSLVSENPQVTFSDIVGKSVTVSLGLADGERRFFNGVISRFSQLSGGGNSEEDHHLSFYSATMVPQLWLLSRSSNSRVFQGLSVPEIIEKIFKERGLSDFRLNLKEAYDKRVYCVQYRETDFNFVSRLLEEEGIFYFFEHEAKKHILVLADSPDAHKPCKQESVRYLSSPPGAMEEDVITSVENAQEIRIGKYTTADYFFETPNTDLTVEAPTQIPLGPGEREIYDYPGEFTSRAAGDRIANLRMQAEEAQIHIIRGSSACRCFSSGCKMTLLDYPREDMNNKSYVLLSVNHEATEPVGPSGGSSGSSGAYYQNSFNCIPYEIPYRPMLDTPKPVIGGSQTAMVVGPTGEEIYTDEHGRVKVQFHWDRLGKKDDKSSCWIRVAQIWAGSGWGGMYIPRIGQEVVVEFLEGDPDRPIIVGCVYHGNNKPPYALPAQKTRSVIKSNSSLGGGGSNEIRFEDKKGSEEIYLHGQKDWTIAIENDKNQTVGSNETLSVAGNRTKTVGANQSESIGSNKTIQVGANHTETIGANMTQNVGSNKAETISVAKALTIGGAYQVTVGGAMNETVGAAKAEEVAGAKVVAVGAHSSENVAASKSVDVGKDIDVKSGKKMSFSAGDDYSVKGEKNGVIEMKDQLTIKVGKASITLKKNGDITIDGKTINIKGSGNIVMKAQKILEN